MCYHVATPKKTDLAKVLPEEVTIQDYTPHFHTSGFDHAPLPVMTIEAPQFIQPMNWGIIPEWSKGMNDAIEVRNKTLNARAETIYTTPMFRNYVLNRCMVFVTGFFEWKHVGKEKVPHFIYMPNQEPFALGAIYTSWQNPETKDTYNGISIITTEANELMAEIHNTKKRMPVVLHRDKWGEWIDPMTSRWDVQALMKPYQDGILQTHEISKLITSRSKDSDVQEVQAPVKGQGKLF